MPEALLRCGTDLVSCDGDEVHGVVDGLQDAQDGGERLLEVCAAFAALAVLQQLLEDETFFKIFLFQ